MDRPNSAIIQNTNHPVLTCFIPVASSPVLEPDLRKKNLSLKTSLLRSTPTLRANFRGELFSQGYFFSGGRPFWKTGKIPNPTISNTPIFLTLFHSLCYNFKANAQCTPTDWQSAVGAIANCRLRIGVSR